MFPATSSTSRNNQHVAQMKLFRKAVCIIFLPGNGFDSVKMAVLLIDLLFSGVLDRALLLRDDVPSTRYWVRFLARGDLVGLACEKAQGPALPMRTTQSSFRLQMSDFQQNFLGVCGRIFETIVILLNPVVWSLSQLDSISSLLSSLILNTAGFDFSACHLCIF